MRIELLASPWCGMCATMKHILGDWSKWWMLSRTQNEGQTCHWRLYQYWCSETTKGES